MNDPKLNPCPNCGREKMFNLIQDSPVWKWFPNNAEMLKLADHLLAHGVTIREQGEWIDQSFILNGGRVHCYTCPKCGCEKNYRSNFCPECGAPLKGETK